MVHGSGSLVASANFCFATEAKNLGCGAQVPGRCSASKSSIFGIWPICRFLGWRETILYICIGPIVVKWAGGSKAMVCRHGEVANPPYQCGRMSFGTSGRAEGKVSESGILGIWPGCGFLVWPETILYSRCRECDPGEMGWLKAESQRLFNLLMVLSLETKDRGGVG